MARALMENEVYPSEQTIESLRYHNIAAFRSLQVKQLASEINTISLELQNKKGTN